MVPVRGDIGRKMVPSEAMEAGRWFQCEAMEAGR